MFMGFYRSRYINMEKLDRLTNVRKELDNLFSNADNIEKISEIPPRIDELIEEGFDVKDYIPKYNAFVQEFYSKK
jgi:hypothetical protein